jgi:hypothetical protein
MVLIAAVTLASAVFVMAPAGATPSGQPVPQGWTVRPGMLLAGSNLLQSVFCTSRANCWAVGLHAAKTGALINQIVRWNGKRWTRVPAPNPAGTGHGDFNTLSAVRCTSAANCWAVGADANRGQALHWNGTRWRLVPTPQPGGTSPTGFTGLRDVVCPSPDSCWAAGLYGHDAAGSQTFLDLVLHWNGKKWFKVTTPNPAGTHPNDVNELASVRCASPDNCWAAGSEGVNGMTVATSVLLNDVLHWNGRKWSTQTVPDPAGSTMGSYNTLHGLACSSASNCWAVGEYRPASAPSTDLNQSLHWNGRKWSRVTTPDPDGMATGATNTLIAVNCTAKNNCWAVGYFGNNSTEPSQKGQALHWSGSKWTLTATPNPAGTTNQATNSLESVRCNIAADCWIVGESAVNGDPYVNLFLHWNGVKWTAR